MTTPTLRVLREAHALICTPGGWTSGAQARNLAGHPVAPTSEHAVAFSLYGAVVRAAAQHPGGFMAAYNLLRTLTPHAPYKADGHESLHRFSETRGQEACLDLLNTAIDLAYRQAPLEKENLE